MHHYTNSRAMLAEEETSLRHVADDDVVDAASCTHRTRMRQLLWMSCPPPRHGATPRRSTFTLRGINVYTFPSDGKGSYVDVAQLAHLSGSGDSADLPVAMDRLRITGRSTSDVGMAGPMLGAAAELDMVSITHGRTSIHMFNLSRGASDGEWTGASRTIEDGTDLSTREETLRSLMAELADAQAQFDEAARAVDAATTHDNVAALLDTKQAMVAAEAAMMPTTPITLVLRERLASEFVDESAVTWKLGRRSDGSYKLGAEAHKQLHFVDENGLAVDKTRYAADELADARFLHVSITNVTTGLQLDEIVAVQSIRAPVPVC